VEALTTGIDAGVRRANMVAGLLSSYIGLFTARGRPRDQTGVSTGATSGRAGQALAVNVKPRRIHTMRARAESRRFRR